MSGSTSAVAPSPTAECSLSGSAFWGAGEAFGLVLLFPRSMIKIFPSEFTDLKAGLGKGSDNAKNQK